MTTQPDLFFTGQLPTDDMGLDEIAHRLIEALRDGRLDASNRGPVLGFLAALKRPKGPSFKQIQLARGLVKEIRRDTPWESQRLVDTGDTYLDADDCRAMARDAVERERDYAEF